MYSGTVSHRLRGTPEIGLLSGTLAFFSGFAAVALFGTNVDIIRDKLSLSIIETGWILSSPLISGSLLRIPFAALVDRIGGKIVLTVQLMLSIAGIAGVIFTLSWIMSGLITSSLTGFILVMFFGAASGTGVSTFSSGIAYVSYWYPENRQGSVLGIFGGAGNTGPAVFTILLPVSIMAFGLISTYVIWGVFLAVSTILFVLIASDSYFFQLAPLVGKSEALQIARKQGLELFPSGSMLKSLKNSAVNWRILALSFMYFISFGGFEALTVWFPSYWTYYIGTSRVEAGIFTGILFTLLTALMRIPGGWMCDRYGALKIAIPSYSVLIVGSLLLFFSNFLGLSIVAALILGTGMGVSNAAVFSLIPKYSGSSIGGASGLVGGLGSAGGLLVPPAMAYFVFMYGDSGYSLGFVIFTVAGVIALFLAMFLRHADKNQYGLLH